MNNALIVQNHFENYSSKLQKILASTKWHDVAQLASDLLSCWKNKSHVYICGNGGSAGNANHLANDFIYGVAKTMGAGLRISSLSANPSVITCLANDVGYESVYSEQLAVLGQENDLLIVLSGSGNSANIVRVLEQAKKMSLKSYAILGYDGGLCKKIADTSIHFPVEDMQMAEDLQLISGHMIMQWLYDNRN